MIFSDVAGANPTKVECPYAGTDVGDDKSKPQKVEASKGDLPVCDESGLENGTDGSMN